MTVTTHNADEVQTITDLEERIQDLRLRRLHEIAAQSVAVRKFGSKSVAVANQIRVFTDQIKSLQQQADAISQS